MVCSYQTMCVVWRALPCLGAVRWKDVREHQKSFRQTTSKKTSQLHRESLASISCVQNQKCLMHLNLMPINLVHLTTNDFIFCAMRKRTLLFLLKIFTNWTVLVWLNYHYPVLCYTDDDLIRNANAHFVTYMYKIRLPNYFTSETRLGCSK